MLSLRTAPGFLSDHLHLFIGIQHLLLCGSQNTIQATKHSHRQYHVFVLVRAIRSTQQIRNGPNKTNLFVPMIHVYPP